MSNRFTPPTGPRSSRNYNEEKGASVSYKSSYGQKDGSSRDRYPPSGPKRYAERDFYRSSSSYGNGYQSSQGYRNSGPSQYKSNDYRNYNNSNNNSGPETGPGGKRSIPGSQDDFHKNKKRRDFIPPTGPSQYQDKHDGFKSSKFDDKGRRPKMNMNNFPKGPRSTNGRPPFDNSRKPSNSYRESSVIKKPPQKLLKSQLFSVKTTRPSEIYQRVQQVGEGTYGKVYKARNSITDEYVALKKLRLESEREGFPITAMREIKLLQSFDHENVISLLEMMVEKNQIYMIFDYMDHDLTGLLTHPELDLSESHRKFIFKQLMEGVNYLHKRRIIHRDIKGSNILLDSIGRLKIADFGLARSMKILNDGESPDYTNRVITIWYRPPELLLGSTEYGREIDIWGLGCLLIELYSKTATFQGFDEVGQLQKIFSLMGTPNLEDWPEIENMPWFEMLKPKINLKNSFREKYAHLMTENSFTLAEELLRLNPYKRLTAADALNHPYFTDDPQPEPLTFLKDMKGEWHEFETKKRRRKERKRLQEEKHNSSISTDPSLPQIQPEVRSDTTNVKSPDVESMKEDAT